MMNDEWWIMMIDEWWMMDNDDWWMMIDDWWLMIDDDAVDTAVDYCCTYEYWPFSRV